MDILVAFGRDPKWLGGEIGITMVRTPGARTSINTSMCIAWSAAVPCHPTASVGSRPSAVSFSLPCPL